jgi:hypothetical protein
VEEDVLRFQVIMNDSLLLFIEVLESREDL